METKSTRAERKKELIELSIQARELRETMKEGAISLEDALYWQSRTINFMLLNHIYETDGATEFNTFKEWKAQGATIKKGVKAFAIWGQPLNKKSQNEEGEQPQAKAEEEQAEGEEDYSFFPICYLFSNKQVITQEEQDAEREKQRQRQAQEKAREEAEARRETVEMDIVT